MLTEVRCFWRTWLWGDPAELNLGRKGSIMPGPRSSPCLCHPCFGKALSRSRVPLPGGAGRCWGQGQGWPLWQWDVLGAAWGQQHGEPCWCCGQPDLAACSEQFRASSLPGTEGECWARSVQCALFSFPCLRSCRSELDV